MHRNTPNRLAHGFFEQIEESGGNEVLDDPDRCDHNGGEDQPLEQPRHAQNPVSHSNREVEEYIANIGPRAHDSYDLITLNQGPHDHIEYICKKAFLGSIE